MTISEALVKYPNIEADLLLGHVLKESKEFLYMNGEQKLTAKQGFSFEMLAEKRTKGIPIAYLVGYKDFHGMKFKVNKDVLIPRPESEWLVEEAFKIIGGKSLSVLDVGTGSGCIAISIAKNSRAFMTATDISDRALVVAKSNARGRNKVKFVKSDLLENVTGTFDIIIANLPYVPESEYKKHYEGIKHEPKLAITDDKDGNSIILKLLSQIDEHLNTDATVLLEIDPKNSDQLMHDINLLNKFKTAETFTDIQNLVRYVKLTT